MALRAAPSPGPKGNKKGGGDKKTGCFKVSRLNNLLRLREHLAKGPTEECYNRVAKKYARLYACEWVTRLLVLIADDDLDIGILKEELEEKLEVASQRGIR